MDKKLQELTDKIYLEGVEKGKAEAAAIIAGAKKDAEKIYSDAKDMAAKVVASAEKDAENIKSAANSELQMASQKAVNALKQEVSQLIQGDIVNKDIKAATADVKFLQSAIETAVKNWSANIDGELSMKVIVPEADEKAILDYFANTAKGVLDKGFTIESANNVKAGFQVMPADGSYKVSFTDQDFAAFFKEFVRPSMAKLLF